MNQLLAEVLDAHGGLNRWNEYHKVNATIVSGGGFFQLKGIPQDSAPRRMTVWLHDERSSVMPYGAPDQRTMYTPERIAIEKLNGTLVARMARGALIDGAATASSVVLRYVRRHPALPQVADESLRVITFVRPQGHALAG